MSRATAGFLKQWGWYCQECGHRFQSAAAAERAVFGDGCPKCGGTDVDESLRPPMTFIKEG